MSALPQNDNSLEQIAQRCILDITRNFPDSSPILIDYQGRTYIGVAKLLNPDSPDRSILKISRLLPAIEQDIAAYIHEHRPGIVRLKARQEIPLISQRVFYVSLDDLELRPLSAQELNLVVRQDPF